MNRILNFGSLNIDNVYTMPHIVKPGETLSSDCLNHYCGGKGLNQSVALSRAGGTVFHAGKIGSDGEMLKKVLVDNKIDISYLKETDGKSGHAIIQVERKGQNCILLYGGANREIDEGMINEVLSDFDSGDILVCQNEISCMGALIAAAKAKGIPIALNPSPIDEDMVSCDLSAVTYLLINEIEGKDFTGMTEPEKICEELLLKAPNLKIVLTLGKDGVLYRDSEITASHGIYNVPVVDTTAAGDTFLGFFIAGSAAGSASGAAGSASGAAGATKESVFNALKIASAASSLAVSKAGAVPSIPTIDEVMRFIEVNG